MATYTVKLTYHAPEYKHVAVEAESADEEILSAKMAALDTEVKRILSMSEVEIEMEIRAEGKDLKTVADEMRLAAERAILRANVQRIVDKQPISCSFPNCNCPIDGPLGWHPNYRTCLRVNPSG